MCNADTSHHDAETSICMQLFDWQQMMKSPMANWHFVRWLAQRYDGETPCLLCNHFRIHRHDSKYSDLAFLIIDINRDMK